MWYLPETLQGIDDGGADSIVFELIECFQIDTAGRFVSLHDAVGRLDAATVRSEAHSVRGSARQMGAEPLAALCQALETGAPRMNWPELECQLSQAEARFGEVCCAMSEYVKSRQSAV